MKRVRFPKIFVVLFIIAPVIIAPGHLCATLFHYTADGEIEIGSQTYTVTGDLLIDDTLRLWGGSPAQPATQIGNGTYSYFISRYSLCLLDVSSPQETFLFNGSCGNFYMERAEGFMGDSMWFLDNGRGSWDDWWGDGFYFYHSDWTPYDLYSEIGVLAPYIRLQSVCGMHCVGQDILRATADITLSRVAPVPEPATLILMGLGLVGLAGCGRKYRS
jgi:hypothetical protein